MSRIITVVAVVRVELEPAARFTAGLRDVPGHSDALVWRIWGRVGKIHRLARRRAKPWRLVSRAVPSVWRFDSNMFSLRDLSRLRGRVETDGVGVGVCGVECGPRVL